MKKIILNIIKLIREQTDLSECKIADIRKKSVTANQDDLERIYDAYCRFGVNNINDIIFEERKIN